MENKSIHKNTKHGYRNHRLYGVWRQMMQRCYNKNHKSYCDYGKRDITVCNEWHNIENFISDMYPTFQEKMTLDRVNNNLNYCKENCRWTQRNIQARNTRILRKTNTSGYRGVHWHKRDKKWIAQVCVNYKNIELGRFYTAMEAAKARDNYIAINNLEHTVNF